MALLGLFLLLIIAVIAVDGAVCVQAAIYFSIFWKKGDWAPVLQCGFSRADVLKRAGFGLIVAAFLCFADSQDTASIRLVTVIAAMLGYGAVLWRFGLQRMWAAARAA